MVAVEGPGRPARSAALWRAGVGWRRSLDLTSLWAHAVHLATGSLVAVMAVALVDSAPLSAQSSALPPDAEWRVLESDHFRFTYDVSLSHLADRLALESERAWAFLSQRFLEAPDSKIEVVLTDHVDDSNGFTAVTPRGRIVLFARPPVDDFALTHYADWLGLLMTHELTHYFQLDRTGPLGALTRFFLGRFPETWPSFPERALPDWTLEGIATWYESAATGGGRVFGSALPMMLRTAAIEGAIEGIGPASGDSEVWPEGTRPYLYGTFFIDYLVDRFGEAAISDWVRAVEGQWIPYRVDAAARSAFGMGVTEVWAEWEQLLAADATALVSALEARRALTRTETVVAGARFHTNPRVSPTSGRVWFGRADGRSDAQLLEVEPGNPVPAGRTRVNRLGSFTFDPAGGVVFAQPDFTDRYRLRSDLYHLGTDGSVRRLTEDQRLDHPDLALDGQSGVAIRYTAGDVELVEFELEPLVVRPLTAPDSGTYWAHPRISPDGTRIAVTRWLPDGFADLVILDRAGRVIERVTDDAFDDLTPTWSPSGQWLLWVSDRTGIANVHAVRVGTGGSSGPPLQVTHVTGGVAEPAVDAGGDWLYFAAYHAGGWQVERTAFDPEAWAEPLPHLSELVPGSVASGLVPGDADGVGEAPPPFDVPFVGGVATGVAPVAGDSIPRPMPRGSYRPWRYLLPTFLEPVIDFGTERGSTRVLGPSFGLRTSGSDLVGRHQYDMEGMYEPDGERWAGRVRWSWLGAGNPVLSVSARQSFGAGGPFRVRTDDAIIGPFFFVERERQVGGSLGFVSRSWRRSISLTLGGSLVHEERSFYDAALEEVPLRLDALPRTARLVEGSVQLSTSTARGYGRSISVEAGGSAFARLRIRRDLDVVEPTGGSQTIDRSFEDVTGGFRLFRGLRIGGTANHVFAIRAAAGWATGSGADGFHFDLGGAEGQPETVTGLGLFGGTRLLFPLRGVERGTKSGSRIWSASAEYRIPLGRANWGPGVIPLHFDDVYFSAFADGGDAWGPEDGVFSNPAADPIVAVGGELAVEILPFWTIPLVVRGGVAIPVAGVPESTARFHLRLGVSF